MLQGLRLIITMSILNMQNTSLTVFLNRVYIRFSNIWKEITFRQNEKFLLKTYNSGSFLNLLVNAVLQFEVQK